MRFSMLRLLGGAVMAVWLLTGCATGYVLDNTVQSFSQSRHCRRNPPTASSGCLRSRPLPRAARSHGRSGALQGRVAAGRREPALQRASWRPASSGSCRRGPIPGMAGDRSAWGITAMGLASATRSAMAIMEPPWFQREVSIIMRELPSNRAVYETRAFNDGPWRTMAQCCPSCSRQPCRDSPPRRPGPAGRYPRSRDS